MAFDPIQEDCHRLVLRLRHDKGGQRHYGLILHSDEDVGSGADAHHLEYGLHELYYALHAENALNA